MISTRVTQTTLASGTTPGVVVATGVNTGGELGDGTTSNRSFFGGVLSPAPSQSALSATAVAAGSLHNLALMADGTVCAWGDNLNGQLGVGTITFPTVPINVETLSQVIAIAAGGDHSLALLVDGTVRAWGRNDSCQLGDGTQQNRTKPVAVVECNQMIAIAAGRNHGLALRADGTVWAWGSNQKGQLGFPPFSEQTKPLQVPGLAGVVAIAAGGAHSLALRADGGVWTWGWNHKGQLGDGTTIDRYTPKWVFGSVLRVGIEHAISIAGGDEHSLALAADGRVWSWGSNHKGQLGTGTTQDRFAPGLVVGPGRLEIALGGVSAIAAGGWHSMALKSNGSVFTGDTTT